MKFDTLALALSSIGALLVVTAIVLKTVIVPQLSVQSVWSREEAEVHTEISLKYHNQSFDTKLDPEELAATAEAYRAQAAKLEAARNRRSRLPKYFQYSGIVFIVAGAVCYYVHKAKSEP